jgi:hypothetical protein
MPRTGFHLDHTTLTTVFTGEWCSIRLTSIEATAGPLTVTVSWYDASADDTFIEAIFALANNGGVAVVGLYSLDAGDLVKVQVTSGTPTTNEGVEVVVASA